MSRMKMYKRIFARGRRQIVAPSSWGTQRLYSRRPYRVLGGGRPTANQKASTALRMIRKIKDQQEKKTNESFAATMQIPIGGNWIVNGFGPYMAQGDTSITREGNKITVQSLVIRFLIKLTALEAVGTAVRICVVKDIRPGGADATTANMFTTDNQINSGYVISGTNKGRFQFLMDKTYPFDSAQAQRAGKFFLKKDIEVDLSLGNAGTVADCAKNNFLILAMAEGNAAAINVDYGFRFRFVDI